MRAAVWALAGLLVAVPVRGQETQTDPAPNLPAPKQVRQQPPVPVERRSAHPTATAPGEVDGPIVPGRVQPPSGGGQRSGSGSAAPVDAGTIRVETRLVNVAVNVVDAHGSPVGGFERADFRVFEDGRPQEIAVFERDTTSPLSIVLAIDASETVLTSERLEKQAAKRFVRGILRPQDELAVMEFADTVRELVPFTNEEKRIEQGVGEIRPGQETALYDAVYLASEELGTTSGAAGRRRVLVVISDGGDSKRESRYAEAVAEAQRAGAMIFSIIIVPVAADAGRNTGGEHTMIQMSEDTGGKYYYVTDPADLEPAFRHVSDDLRTQYLLGYYAPKAARGEGGFRRIQVKLGDAAQAEKFALRYRTGYYADAK